MKKFLLLSVAGAVCCVASADGFDRKSFAEPESLFSPGYFWMWNAKLDVARLKAQLDDMAAHDVRSVCIHPFPKDFRPGRFRTDMEPDYLTPEYFEVVSNVVDHMAALGMSSWLYDEGGWPSGGACGLVAASDADGRFRQRFYGRRKATDEGPNGVWLKPYGTGRDSLPSVIEPGATERFIDLTHEMYKKYIGRHFGRTIRFAFMDEPAIPYGAFGPSLGWSSDFTAEFKRRKGYDIMAYADRLLAERGGYDAELSRVWLDYNEVLGSLYVERFHGRIADWCGRNGIKSSGHMNGEDAPELSVNYGQCGVMRCLRALDVPGVDVIWRQLYPTTYTNPGAQPPFPRYASSVANQKGERLALSESLGIYGDSLEPGVMKWLADYQMVRGINLFVFGYYALSNAGQWMLLFEPHSGPVTSWWDFMGPYFRYIARTSSLMASGRPVTDIVVYYDDPAFMLGGAEAAVAGNMHYAVAKSLDRLNCEYDFAEDAALAKAEVRGGKLVVGKTAYSTLVLPTAKWMGDKAREKVELFKREGGKVLSPDALGEAPRVCGINHHFAYRLRVAKRVNGAQSLYFIVNETPWQVQGAEISFAEKGNVVHADAESGRFVAVEAKSGKFKWTIPGYGSAMFIVGDVAADEPARREFREDDDFVPPYTVADGWTLQAERRHYAGEDDFVIEKLADAKMFAVALGDWRSVLGDDFSGRAVYRTEFNCGESAERYLDLGKVGWCCSVKFNGEDLGAKFFGPYRWRVKTVKGRNTIEVTVANMLCNALSPAVRERISKKYPPSWGYEMRHARFDRENNESGLFGPVTLR